MAYETITLGNIVTRVARLQVGTAAPQTSYADRIKGMYHAALREWVRECRPACLHAELATPLSLTAGTRDYPLADDFAVMAAGDDAVFCTETPFSPLAYATPHDTVRQRWQDSARQGDPPTHYALPHSDATTGIAVIRFNPWPSATGRKINYRYIATPPSYEGAADNTVIDKRIPPDLHDGLVWGVLAMMPGETPDPQRFAMYEARWRTFKAQTRAASNRVIGVVRQRAAYGSRGYRPYEGPAPTVDGTALSP